MELIIGLTIHLFVPAIGLAYFLRIIKQMKTENIANPPALELFIIFSTYGGLLLVILTTYFWQWSGMASLGTFYLILGAPIAMGAIAYRTKQAKTMSKYHYWTYI